MENQLSHQTGAQISYATENLVQKAVAPFFFKVPHSQAHDLRFTGNGHFVGKTWWRAGVVSSFLAACIAPVESGGTPGLGDPENSI